LAASPKKGVTAVAVKKGIPYNHVDLGLTSVEATRVGLPIGNCEVLLAAVCKSPVHAWNDADITELLSFRQKALLAGDLNFKHPFWNSLIFNPSGVKLLNLLHINEFQISAPQYSNHCCPSGNGDVLDIVGSKNIRLSEAIASDILNSGNLLILFHLLNLIRTRNLWDPDDKFSDWKRFQSPQKSGDRSTTRQGAVGAQL
jgi:hypothetical protein